MNKVRVLIVVLVIIGLLVLSEAKPVRNKKCSKVPDSCTSNNIMKCKVEFDKKGCYKSCICVSANPPFATEAPVLVTNSG